jgi:hypothetical protein
MILVAMEVPWRNATYSAQKVLIANGRRKVQRLMLMRVIWKSSVEKATTQA